MSPCHEDATEILFIRYDPPLCITVKQQNKSDSHEKLGNKTRSRSGAGTELFLDSSLISRHTLRYNAINEFTGPVPLSADHFISTVDV